MVGDLNLPKIDWNNYTSNVTLEQDFLNTFAENSLLQRINVPTNRHGNTLDLLLTTSPNFVENIVVRKDTLLCKSDHFLLTFDINLKCKRSKVIKRDCFNYTNANWDSLNAELNEISWPSILESMHSDSAWQNFTEALTSCMERHMPKTKLKSKFQPIWYDSECHQKCK